MCGSNTKTRGSLPEAQYGHPPRKHFNKRRHSNPKADLMYGERLFILAKVGSKRKPGGVP